MPLVWYWYCNGPGHAPINETRGSQTDAQGAATNHNQAFHGGANYAGSSSYSTDLKDSPEKEKPEKSSESENSSC